MLTPQTLSRLPDPLVDLVNELQTEIIQSIAKKLTKANYLTPSAEWQLYKAAQLRMSTADVNKLLRKYTKLSKREIAALYTEACKQAINNDAKIYRYYGKDADSFTRSVAFSNSLKAGIKNADGMYENLTRSMVQSSRKTVTHLMDKAYLKVLSGAFSPQEAIYSAVKELADKGIQSVTYPSGRTDWADVAVRRAVITGIGQTTGRMQLDLAEDMGTDLVEVTAHSGARPSHAEWQGKVYSISGKSKKYPSLRAATGYGRGDGLKGWNCRHDFFPFFEGLSERANFPVDKEENLREYELEQKQRGMERAIRKSKRGLAALDSAIGSADDEELKAKLQSDFDRKSNTLKRQEARLSDFCESNGLLPRNDRTRVIGFGRSVSQKAVHGNNRYLKSKKPLTDSYSNAIIKIVNGESPYEFVPIDAEKKVPKLDIFGAKDAKNPNDLIKAKQLNRAHEKASKDLLKHVRADNAEAGIEYSMIYDDKMRKIKGWDIPHKGVVGGAKIDYDEKPFHAFHNHGSNGALSFADIDGFSKNNQMLSLTAQGNNGKNKYTVFKIENYDEDGYNNFLLNKSRESFFSIGERKFTLYDVATSSEFDSMTKEQKEEYLVLLTSKTKECLLGGKKYGIKYISSET